MDVPKHLFVCILLLLTLLAYIHAWSGSGYWNGRYSGQGISYPTGQDMWQSLWSHSNAYLNYFYTGGSYSGYSCSGCSGCDDSKFIIKTCTGSSVYIINRKFYNFSADNFGSNVQKIRVMLVEEFTTVNEATFSHLSKLNEIVIHRTGLRQLPNLTGTVVVKAMFGDNNITFFDHNHTNPTWPSELTHLNLVNNDIDWVPDELFCGTNIEYLGLSRNKIFYFPYKALCDMPKLLFLEFLGMYGTVCGPGMIKTPLPIIENNTDMWTLSYNINLSTSTRTLSVADGNCGGLNENKIKSINTAHFAPLAFGKSPLQHMNLSNNEIYWIQPGGLATMTELKILELHGNSFERILAGQFDNITELLHLDISANKIQILYGESFTNMQNLRFLSVHKQSPKMTNLYYNAFRNINDNLKDLWVSDNALPSFPHQVLDNGENYYSLHSVWAGNNKIIEPMLYGIDGFPPRGSIYAPKILLFKPWISSPNIQRLWLNGNSIPDLDPSDFCVLLNLKQLYLYSNKLKHDTVQTHQFKCNPNIWYLHLASNLFEYVPTFLRYKENMPSITHLLMQNNKITYIETDAMTEIDSLLYLWMYSNKILTIEDDVFPKSIRQLHLYSNEFRFTHEGAFRNLSELQILNLQSNQITIIPDNAFILNEKLYYIQLQNNQIARLTKGIFADGPTTYDRIMLNNNDIGWIEPGTFNHISKITYLYLHSNKLTDLPIGDFHNLTATYFNLNSNRLPRVRQNTFNNLVVSRSLNMQSNRLVEVEPYAFINVNCGDNLQLQSNHMKTLNTNSFVNVTCDNLYLHSMEITHLPYMTMNNVYCRASLYLNNNNISTIEVEAMHIRTSQHIRLYSNQVDYIKGQIFKTGSSVNTLYLYRNQLKNIPVNAFVGLSAHHVDLRWNQLYDYPDALNVLNLQTIDVSYNDISELKLDDFSSETQIRTLNFRGNELLHVPKDLLKGLTLLTTFDFRQNDITEIDADMFAGLKNLRYIYLSSNKLYYMNQIPPELKALDILDLDSNKIRSLDFNFTGHINATLFDSLKLNGNPLTCDCQLYQSMLNIEKKVTSGTCTSPTSNPNLNGVRFAYNQKSNTKYFQKQSDTDFLCSPMNVTAASPENLVVTVSWLPPTNQYIFGPVVDPNSVDWTYKVRCDSTLAGSVSADTKSLNHTFTESNGIRGDTQYTCVVRVDTGSGISADSVPGVVTSLAPLVESNVVIAPEDIVLPVTYYDFSAAHLDFNNLATTDVGKDYNRPAYVPSPYGAWLSNSEDPQSQSFSEWFRIINTNYNFDRSLIVKGITGENTNRYYSDSYFPVDGLGYGDQNQKDCSNQKHNFGFTSAIRSGFVFQGTENITVGGGDEIWLYINRTLVLQTFTPTSATNVECKRIRLYPAVPEGGGYLIIETGLIVSGKCALTAVSNDTAEQVRLDLTIGERYHFTLFHTERYRCKSNFYIESQGTQFVTDPAAFDYIAYIKENFTVNAVIEEIMLADIFSAGPPFTINVLKGNEARHFTIVDGIDSNRILSVTPPPPVYTYTTVEGLSFVECPTPAVKIPEGDDKSIESFTIQTSTALVLLKTEVDYEVATNYTLTLQIVDNLKSPALTGEIVLKIRLYDINDNCPVLKERVLYYFANLSLQVDPVITGVATDADSTINKQLTFTRSSVTANPPIDYNATQDLYRIVYKLHSNLTFLMVVTDGGVPTRGSYANITIKIHNSCLIDENYKHIYYDFVVNATTGDMYIRVPGYYQEELTCNRTLGVESAVVTDAQLNASSEQRVSRVDRVRLNEVTLPDNFDGLTGGWLPSVNDKNQWVQVDMLEPYIFSQVWIQGRDDLPNWITSFYIYYSDDGVNWIKYNDTASGSSGSNTTTVAPVSSNVTDWALMPGAVGQDNITKVMLDPVIYARYLRINPQSWVGNISLRFELAGCTQEWKTYYFEACLSCPASWYCIGDGILNACGRCNPPQENSTCGRSATEHSFGRSNECSPCLLGWLCHDGLAKICLSGSYANCTNDSCPTNCTDCEAGFECLNGRRNICVPGKFSKPKQDYCDKCVAGTYQNETGQEACIPCDKGYYSAPMALQCNPCELGTYSDGSGICESCSDMTQCPCMNEDSPPCFTYNNSYAVCLNTGSGGHGCLPCPVGFRGDGTTCDDIDECAENNPCFQSHCVNTVPGYQCQQCPNGYTGSYEDALGVSVQKRVFDYACNGNHSEVIYQTCEDINECLTNNGRCDPNAWCYNTIGSFNCGKCKIGWVGDAFYGCRPANFCASGEATCDSNHAICLYTGPGRYKCECVNGWAGDGFLCAIDPDQDGVPTDAVSCTTWNCQRDNCPNIGNSGQEDNDNDKLGDTCDPDDDDDTVYDFMDNCPMTFNVGQVDSDGDHVGDDCDNCKNNVNTDQSDVDNDGIGDVCDTDADQDGIANGTDNCPLVANADQKDTDNDGVGDVCDNCIPTSNANQQDTNQNNVGDICENKDADGDGIYTFLDNCVLEPNPEQKDTDGDGFGDECDHDIDGDGVHNDVDNCLYVANADQKDVDGNHVGDACDNDLDGDGVIDRIDICPTNKFINVTDFTSYDSINLYPTSGDEDVSWMVLFQGQEVRQVVDTNATAIFLGKQYLGDMDYRGTVYVNDDICAGYIGVVFGYQSNKKFYIAMWRHKHLNWHGTSYRPGLTGLQIMRVISNSGPSAALAKAIWYSDDTTNEVTLLYHDRTLTGWECKTSYHWHLLFRPSIGTMRFLWKKEEVVIVDSGEIYDTSIFGGRVGVFVYAQPGVIFSKLLYECKESENYALQFDGTDDYATMADVNTLMVNASFTIETWVFLDANYPMTKMPILCNYVGTLCMYLESGILHGQIGEMIAFGKTVISAYTWTHLVMRFNAEECYITLYVNGTGSGYEKRQAWAPAIDWETATNENETTLYLGRQGDHYFKGTMDEFRLYDVFVKDSEINELWQTSGMYWENHKKFLVQYFDFNNNPNNTILEDKSHLHLNASLSGGTFRLSQSNKARFKNTYPSNRRRRRSISPAIEEFNLSDYFEQANNESKQNDNGRLHSISPTIDEFNLSDYFEQADDESKQYDNGHHLEVENIEHVEHTEQVETQEEETTDTIEFSAEPHLNPEEVEMLPPEYYDKILLEPSKNEERSEYNDRADRQGKPSESSKISSSPAYGGFGSKQLWTLFHNSISSGRVRQEL